MERFQIGDILVFNEFYGGAPQMPHFRGELVGYSKKVISANGDPCARLKRLDTNAGRVELWAQSYLKKETKV